MYDIKNLNIWKKGSQSQFQMTRSRMKVISKDKVFYSIYLGKEFVDSDLAALNLSVRAYNGLRRAGYKTVGDLVDNIESEYDLGRIRNLGKTSIQEIMAKLIDYHLNMLTLSEREIYKKQFDLLNSTDTPVVFPKSKECNEAVDVPHSVEFMQDVTGGEYCRLKKIYADAGISIKEPHVGEFKFKVYKNLINADIEELELSTRPYNALKRMGISKILDIPQSSELRKIRNLGNNSIYEIMDRLFEYHYWKIDPGHRYEYLMYTKQLYEA